MTYERGCLLGAGTAEIMQSWLEIPHEAGRSGDKYTASLLLLISSLAEPAGSHLTEELGKCSLAHKISPSILQSRAREEQVMGWKENSPRTSGTSVGMFCDHCPNTSKADHMTDAPCTYGHHDSCDLVLVCSLWDPWSPGVQAQQPGGNR